ncbi:MAG TPA: type III pantothenate kinase [Bacteroidales bacterium]
MQLILDIGNSYAKLAVFDGPEIIEMKVSEDIVKSKVEDVLNTYPKINAAILSDVRGKPQLISEFLSQRVYFIELSHTTPVPFSNLYQSPATLGKDRIACVAAALKMFPLQNVLVIDAGTCITYDLVNNKSEYLGGAISPGINMRFKALHDFTGKLPLIKATNDSIPELIGNNTNNSIYAGVQKAVLLEVDAMINEYQSRFQGLKTILSGGDYFYFDKNLKSNIFATPNIVIKGLKEILDFNEDSKV